MEIKNFSLDKMVDNLSILMITNKESSKEIVIKEIINLLKTKIRHFIIICNNSAIYDSFIDDRCIYNKYDNRYIEGLTSLQYRKKKYKSDYQYAFILLDECFTFHSHKHYLIFNNLIFNSKHYNISYILTTRDPIVTQDYIFNMDYVFIFNSDKQQLLHEYYCKNLEYKLFKNIFNETTLNDNCLVIDKDNNVYRYNFMEIKYKISDKQNIFCNIIIFCVH